MNIAQITPAVKLAEQKEYFQQLVAGEAVDSSETQRIAKDGRVLNVWLTVTKVLERPTDSVISTDQEIVRPVGFALLERNITGRKRVEEETSANTLKMSNLSPKLTENGEQWHEKSHQGFDREGFRR
jgi:hypothetical protein